MIVMSILIFFPLLQLFLWGKIRFSGSKVKFEHKPVDSKSQNLESTNVLHYKLYKVENRKAVKRSWFTFLSSYEAIKDWKVVF